MNVGGHSHVFPSRPTAVGGGPWGSDPYRCEQTQTRNHPTARCFVLSVRHIHAILYDIMYAMTGERDTALTE
ncbi:MAG: hypothetical protein J07HQW2_00630 [Haloquadratum walsbyi J07HQW2]|uniref:Uncharacterized protein n=1 Tax=Haloquadratum walsbyi J07HQW2 TaxID=1238425 RepID=U1PPG7_9EURY|nr:MAG: hypothetical protein J07HQW2_00630 [Haloquadratum walsbyi J07HQW2]